MWDFRQPFLMITMHVGMYYNNSKVLVEEAAVPEISDRDILIKVMACGICGSDLLEWYRIKRAPLVLGHEVAGEVVKVGKEVTNFKKGDRVFSTHHVPCNACHYCLTGHETACTVFQTENNFNPGGFAEYLKISGRSLQTGTFLLPGSVSYEQASFIEPLGTVVRGLRTADIKPADSLLVLGSGIAGLLVIKLARSLGAGRIIATDVNDFRLKAASKMGAEHVISADSDVPEFIRQVNNGRLVDKVMLCTGALTASKQALQSVDRGGTVVFFAVPKPGESIAIDFNPFWRNDVSFKTSYGAAPADNAQALELIRTGSVVVDDMITHRFSLDDIGRAFNTASECKECIKVIIEPG